jgi:hypothetical protein
MEQESSMHGSEEHHMQISVRKPEWKRPYFSPHLFFSKDNEQQERLNTADRQSACQSCIVLYTVRGTRTADERCNENRPRPIDSAGPLLAPSQ